jgi:hypothetical protein
MIRYHSEVLMVPKRNARKQERTPSDALVTIRWSSASGQTRFARGKILDCSEKGVRIEVIEPIETRSYVTLDAPELDRAGWAGWGSVRYCVLRRAKYILGVELSAGAHWNRTASAVAPA